MMGSEICKTQNLLKFDKHWTFLWKFLMLEYMSLKWLKTDLELCFAEHILNAMMKRPRARFLCILEVQYMIGSVFLFFYHFKTQTFSRLCVFIYYLMKTFISFAVSVISMSNNTYFNQYPFNIIPFTYNRNVFGCFINRNKVQDSLLFQFISE